MPGRFRYDAIDLNCVYPTGPVPMLHHLESSPKTPSRVVVLGAGGFVGHTTVSLLTAKGIETLPLGRMEVDLLAVDAKDRLVNLLRPTDALIITSAKAPCRDNEMLMDNIRMMAGICSALEQKPVAHVVYISSDAVYRDSEEPLTEFSCAEPGSLHGAMHLTREIMLQSVVRAPLAILRPSLLYGASDPHNGYGPNRFRRLADEGREIVLFGEGEERRDHVLIKDVAELIYRVIARRSRGILNIATGDVHSFRAIAEKISTMTAKPVAVRGSPRQGPMPHGGYRPFDIGGCRKAFPDFHYTPLADGLVRAQTDS
jgi:UDP-glucose 4-epimerase